MKARHASRWASSELKDCSRPSSDDFLVYTAQRTARLAALVTRGLLGLGVFQPKEQWSGPSCPGDQASNSRQAGKVLASVFETRFKDGDAMGLPEPISNQLGARLD